jgi:hypothetical protein
VSQASQNSQHRLISAMKSPTPLLAVLLLASPIHQVAASSNVVIVCNFSVDESCPPAVVAQKFDGPIASLLHGADTTRDIAHLLSRQDLAATPADCLIDIQRAPVGSIQVVKTPEEKAVINGVPTSCMGVVQQWNSSPSIAQLDAEYGPIAFVNETAIYAVPPPGGLKVGAKKRSPVGNFLALMAGAQGKN